MVDVAGFVNSILDVTAASNREFALATATGPVQQLIQGQPIASPTPPLSSDEAPLTGSPSKDARLPQTIMGAGTSNSPSPSMEEGRLPEPILSSDS